MAELPPALRFSAFVVAGATGVGKSEVAVELAERCGGEIVGADAFQVYAGLDLLTAKPEPALRARVPHHLIGEIPLDRAFDVAQYAQLAAARLREIRTRGRQPIIVGGTGLYLRALLRGLAELPPADASLRAWLETQPLEDLQEQLRRLDPMGAAVIDLQNPRRVVRALEVCLLTGQPFSSFRREWSAQSAPAAIGVCLTRSRLDLVARIEHRVARMLKQGVVEEVRTSLPMGPTSAQTLGLREIRSLLASEIARPECAARIVQATRQYAKRQETWFRREPQLQSFPLGANTTPSETAERLLALLPPDPLTDASATYSASASSPETGAAT